MYNQNQQNQMVGELPLIGEEQWLQLGYPSVYANGVYHSGRQNNWEKRRGLVRLQHLLHEQSQGKDDKVVLIGEYNHNYWYRRGSLERTKIVYDENILPNWEAFAAELKKKDNINHFQIHDIVLYFKIIRDGKEHSSSFQGCG